MSLSSFLLERHQVISRHLQERFLKMRGRARQRFAPRAVFDTLESRMLMSAAVAYSGTTISLGDSSSGVIQADFNGDGKADLAVINDAGSSVSIMLGNGDGTFKSALVTAFTIAPKYLAVGDFNNDGKMDLAVVQSGSGTNRLSLLLGKGDGTFGSAQNTSLNGTPSTIAVGDFNGDGKDDLALTLTASGSTSVQIELSKGDGTFTAGTSLTSQHAANALAVADLNHDGKDDLIVVNGESDSISIWLGNGKGAFTLTSTCNVDDAPSAVVVGDFNHDGNLDLAVASSTQNNVTILVGSGEGYFTENSRCSVGGKPTGLSIGDVNGDGNIDIIALNYTDATINVLTGNGSGGFSRQNTLSTGATPSMLAVGDFNGDGLTDIAATASGATTLQLYLNTTSVASHTISNGESYTYTDATGDTVTIKFTGDGMLTILQDSTATRADALSIVLSGTTNKSTLAITVSGTTATGKTTSIRLINLGTGKLKSLAAGSVDITGVGIRGDTGSYIRSIVIRDLVSGADIVLPGRMIDGSATVTARVVEDDCHITLGMGISAATFADFGHSSFTTSNIGTLSVTGISGNSLYVGNFAGLLTLTGVIGSGNYALTTATIAGSVMRSVWNIAGAINAITAGSIVNSSLTVTDCYINTLTVKSSMSQSTLTAQGVRTWTVGTTMDLVNVTLGSVEMDNPATYVLGTLTVAGAMTDCAITAAYGSASSISTKSISDESSADGTASQILFTNGTIAKLAVKTSMSKTTVKAATILNWTVGGDLDSVTATTGTQDTATATTLSNLVVTGAIKSSTLTVAYGNAGTISASSISDNSNIKANLGTISKLAVKGNMTDTTVNADRMGNWNVGGNMSGVSALFDSSTFTTVLSSLTVTGSMEATEIEATFGGAGTITANTITSSSKLVFTGGTISTLNVKTYMAQTQVTAAQIGTWNVGKDMTGVVAIVGGSSSLVNSYVLGSLTVSGSMIDCIISADYGSAKSISAGAIKSEYSEEADANTISFANGTIAKLAIKGNMATTTVTARQVGTWTVGGTLDTITAKLGNETMTGRSVLSNLTVTGNMVDCSLTAEYGIATSISVKSIVSSTDTATNVITFDSITALTTKTSMSDTIVTANSIGTWTVGTDMKDVTATLGNDDTVSTLDDTSKIIVLSKLTVGNALNSCTITTQGSVGSITAGLMTSTTINVGKYATDAFGSYETIASLKVTKTSEASPFQSNTIYAWQITSLAVVFPGSSTITTNLIGTLKTTLSKDGVVTTTTTKNVSTANPVTVSGLTLTWVEK